MSCSSSPHRLIACSVYFVCFEYVCYFTQVKSECSTFTCNREFPHYISTRIVMVLKLDFLYKITVAKRIHNQDILVISALI